MITDEDLIALELAAKAATPTHRPLCCRQLCSCDACDATAMVLDKLPKFLKEVRELRQELFQAENQLAESER